MSLRFLSDAEWRLLRDVRLGALLDSPTSFLSAYDAERRYGRWRWQRELHRGHWLVCHPPGGGPRGLLGATWERDLARTDRYLGYLWVEPAARRAGVATRLVEQMLDQLGGEGVTRAWLWVLDGNDSARALYLKLGFRAAGRRQPVRGHPAGFEELFTCSLTHQ